MRETGLPPWEGGLPRDMRVSKARFWRAAAILAPSFALTGLYREAQRMREPLHCPVFGTGV